MKCIIVDDEPIARIGIEKMIRDIPELQHIGSFENANAAASFMSEHLVDLIFLDIQMPGLNGIDFAKQTDKNTLVIFTTAFAEFALDSYEVEAIDYLIKPIVSDRFRIAVEKAVGYHRMLLSDQESTRIEKVDKDFMFVKSERRYFKVIFKDILFIEGLKDYVIIHRGNQKLITHTNLKNAHQLLPQDDFLRVNRSYIINKAHITSFSNNDVYIGQSEISIGNFYRDEFFRQILGNC